MPRLLIQTPPVSWLKWPRLMKTAVGTRKRNRKKKPVEPRIAACHPSTYLAQRSTLVSPSIEPSYASYEMFKKVHVTALLRASGGSISLISGRKWTLYVPIPFNCLLPAVVPSFPFFSSLHWPRHLFSHLETHAQRPAPSILSILPKQCG